MRRLAAVITLTALVACGQQAPPAPTAAPLDIDVPETRAFAMGFTRWPYAFDAAAVEWTWSTIGDHADLIAIHLDTGVPWQEALDGTEFPAGVRADLDDAARRAGGFDTVYVAATPLGADRSDLAGYWNDAGTQQPLPTAWDGLPLDHPDVVAAYLGYCRTLIETLQPDFFAYGIEVDAGYLPDSDTHHQMRGLAAAVYSTLKADYPDLPIMLTFQIESWVAPRSGVLTIIESLLPYTDVVAISAYPYVELDPDQPGPADVVEWMDTLADFGKPVAVAETGYIAEPLVIPSVGVEVAGTPEAQQAYVTELLDAAERLQAPFVVYWEIRDYDQGFEFLAEIGVDQSLLALFRDLGLYDGEGTPRPALAVWDAWLEVPRNR